MLGRHLTGRSALELLSQPETDRQLSHARIVGCIRNDLIQSLVERGKFKRTGGINFYCGVGGNTARP